jgi:hypothetical protein
MRDIDVILAALRAQVPGLQARQIQVVHPGVDDDGVWMVGTGGPRIQLESTTGMCPFLIETDAGPERFTASSIEEAVSIALREIARIAQLRRP